MATAAELNPLTQPPIVQTLFKFLLSGKALCNAARVCKLWRNQADICLRQRRQYCWQLFETTEDFLKKLQHYIEEEVPFRPSTLLVFMTTEAWNQLGCPVPGQKRKLQNRCQAQWKEFCEHTVPSCCQVLCSVTPGIVGTSTDMSVTKETESGKCASILCFGQYPGLKVSLLPSRVEADYAELCQPEPSNLEHVKMLLLMSQFFEGQVAIAHIQSELPEVFILGGVITATQAYHPCAKQLYASQDCELISGATHFVAFQGEEVQVACVKLDEDVNEAPKIEPILRKLKDKTQTFPLERSIAFMFACVARGHYIYSKYNVESSMFRKHFPTMPLFGFFGNGEIGSEYPFLNKSGHKGENLMNSYTTFLAVVALP